MSDFPLGYFLNLCNITIRQLNRQEISIYPINQLLCCISLQVTNADLIGLPEAHHCKIEED